jgi:hypothetical protein
MIAEGIRLLSIFKRSMSPRRRGWAPVRVKKMRSNKGRSIFKRSMSLAKAGMGTGSRQENARKQQDRAFSEQVDTG